MNRARLWLALAVVAAVIIVFPLRLALAIAAPQGLSASAASGTIWSGRLHQARIGGLDLGTLDVGLRPLRLLMGRFDLGIERAADALHGPLSGTIGSGIGGTSVEELTGTVTVAGQGVIPVESVEFTGFSARMDSDGCASAGGQLRVRPSLAVAGLDLRNGLSGLARCANGLLVLALAGQSGLERLDVRVRRDRRYDARLSIRADTPDMARALAAAGFAPAGDGFGVELSGRF